jgi:hypothetical protein
MEEEREARLDLRRGEGDGGEERRGHHHRLRYERGRGEDRGEGLGLHHGPFLAIYGPYFGLLDCVRNIMKVHRSRQWPMNLS